MGQIDSFKRVLGVAGQKTAVINAGIEVKEEVQPEVAKPVSPSVSSPKNEKSTPRAKSTVAVSKDTREQMRLLAFWAFRQGIIKGDTSEDLVLEMIKIFCKKHPEGKDFVQRMLNG